MRGVLGIATAVVKHVADIMRFKNFDKPLILTAIVMDIVQFIAAGPKALEGVCRKAAIFSRDSRLVSMSSSLRAPIIPLRPARTFPILVGY